MHAKAKRKAVQWIDGPGNTISEGVGNKDLSVKPGEDESVGRRGAPQLDVQELELNQQPVTRERKQETQEAPPDPEEGTHEALLDPEEETRKASSDPEEKTREAPLDPEEKRGAPSDPEAETQKAPSDPEVETQGAPSNPEADTREAPSDSEVETKDEAGLEAGSTDLEGPVVPSLQMLTITGNLPPNNFVAHVESTSAWRHGSAAKFSADDRRG